MSRRRLLLALPLAAACAARTGKVDAPVEERAVWDTEKGKQAAQLELVGALTNGNSPDQALSLIADLRAAGVDGPEIDVLQARALRRVGLLDDAEALLLKRTKSDRRYADGWMELGVLRMEQRDVEGAILAFEKTIKLNRSNAEAYNNLGFALMAGSEGDLAVVALRKSLEIDPSQGRTRNNLGFALLSEGRDDEAYRVFRAMSTEADARYNMGLGLELRGDASAASQQYQTALASNPDHRSAQNRLQSLNNSSSAPPGHNNPSP
jgi:tetratricopeptide (TPR) repeat protein